MAKKVAKKTAKKTVTKKPVTKKTTKKAAARDASGTASRQMEVPIGDTEQEHVVVTDHDVHVRIGKTINIGNYESVRVDVGISSKRLASNTIEDTVRHVRHAAIHNLKATIEEAEEVFGN